MRNRKSSPKLTKQVIYRIIAVILALLFLGGIIFAAIPLFGEQALDLTALDSDTYISVGMSFGSDVYSTFNLSSPSGFLIGIPSGGQEIIRVAETAGSEVMAALDTAYYLKNGSYSLENAEGRTPALGGYHLADVNMFSTYEELLVEYRTVDPFIDRGNVFFGYIGNMYMLFVGSFLTYADAQSALDAMSLKNSFFVMSPNRDAVRVVDAGTEQDIFITDTDLCLTPWGTDEDAYIQTPSGYKYEGRFEFSPYTDGDVRGLRLINTLDIESYIYGVIPWEMSAAAPAEALKSQAILARTYAVQSMARHSAYGFDVCKEQHCQMYRGISLGNENVFNAVKGTEGLIVTYDGQPAKVYYSAVSGGSTVSSADAWGGMYLPYLVGMKTEWERYPDDQHGEWEFEIDATKLCGMLKNRGYDLQGQITEAEILEFAENSEYVKSIKFTDSRGKSVTINYSDNIRSALGSVLYSACFTVEKRGMKEPDYIEHIEPAQVLTGNGVSTIPGNKNLIVSTGGGILSIRADDSHRVLTADGERSFSLSYEHGFNARADEENARMKAEYESADAVFVFTGKGWGHGVGMSQLGAKNLAADGKTYAEIISMYFPGTEIRPIDGI